jgi:hypothetical protein
MSSTKQLNPKPKRGNKICPQCANQVGSRTQGLCKGKDAYGNRCTHDWGENKPGEKDRLIASLQAQLDSSRSQSGSYDHEGSEISSKKMKKMKSQIVRLQSENAQLMFINAQLTVDNDRLKQGALELDDVNFLENLDSGSLSPSLGGRSLSPISPPGGKGSHFVPISPPGGSAPSLGGRGSSLLPISPPGGSAPSLGGRGSSLLPISPPGGSAPSLDSVLGLLGEKLQNEPSHQINVLADMANILLKMSTLSLEQQKAALNQIHIALSQQHLSGSTSHGHDYWELMTGAKRLTF